jgi:uncharacterized protein
MNQYFPKSGYYRIKVIPNQAVAEVRNVMEDGTIKIALSSAPEKGKANKELILFVSKLLGVGKESIKLTSGVTSRLKVITVDLN